MSGKLPITVLVMTKNEEATIAEAIQSVSNFQHVLVVDSGSHDNTVVIAKENGAQIIPFEWNGRYPKKRQWTLEWLNITTPWTLFLDADERMTPELEQELSDMIAKPRGFSAYYIKGQPVWDSRHLKFGRWHEKLILFQTGKLHFPDFGDLFAPGMGEIEGHYQPIVNGTVGRLESPIVHDCARDYRLWMTKHGNYASWHAWVIDKKGTAKLSQSEKGLRAISKRVFYSLPIRPFVAFCDSYFLKLGIFDGVAGLSYAKARAWYYREINRKRSTI